MAESDRPSKRQRPEPGDGSGPVAVSGAGGASVGDSSSGSDTAAGRVAVLAQYCRWWKGDGHKTRCLRTLAGHLSWVHAVAVLEGDRIVSSSFDGTLKVWIATDRRRHMAVLQINRHWRDAISNPERKLCRKLLRRQYES